jgi:hypothetical protein
MRRFFPFLMLLIFATATTAFAQVSVTDPADGQAVSPTTHFAASASPGTCDSGVASMGIYIDDALMYVTQGTHLDATLSLAQGQHRAVLQEWDYCGGATKSLVHVTVGGTTISGIQGLPGWNQWGEIPPTLNICDAPCNGLVNWSMYQHQSDVSLSGNATQFRTGGTMGYTDVLWSYPFIGDGAPDNMKDHGHRLLKTLHNFSMDTSVFVTDLRISQAVELDINMFADGVGMEWGTQCNVLGDGAWDIWDNIDARWMPTDIPCRLNNNAWNRVVLQVQRQDNNDLTYQSITVNGQTYSINRTVAPFRVPKYWYGMNVNFQMDSNNQPTPNTEYVDNMSVTYW